jgi:multidrug efflux pump subunit AcrA (membrane-fusion protein)
MAAAVWLIVLREPHVVVAHAAEAHAALPAAEVGGLAGLATYVGVIVAGQDAELGAELSGEVVRVFREPGSRVRRGEPLLQLAALSSVGAQSMASAQDLEDRAAVRSAQLALETASDRIERMQNAPSAYSAFQLAGARSDAARAAAELDRLRGTAAVHRATQSRELARSNKQLVRAPFDGALSARFLDVGDFASPGQPLARVVDDARFVRFALPAPEHARLQVGATVRVVPEGRSLPLMAAVVDIDPELDPAAGLGFARARFTALAAANGAGLE